MHISFELSSETGFAIFTGLFILIFGSILYWRLKKIHSIIVERIGNIGPSFNSDSPVFWIVFSLLTLGIFAFSVYRSNYVYQLGDSSDIIFELFPYFHFSDINKVGHTTVYTSIIWFIPLVIIDIISSKIECDTYFKTLFANIFLILFAISLSLLLNILELKTGWFSTVANLFGRIDNFGYFLINALLVISFIFNIGSIIISLYEISIVGFIFTAFLNGPLLINGETIYWHLCNIPLNDIIANIIFAVVMILIFMLVTFITYAISEDA